MINRQKKYDIRKAMKDDNQYWKRGNQNPTYLKAQAHYIAI